jgi:hypothetical protein
MILNPKDINFLKYKRVFVFGCSFTSYIWPTWADILKTQMPNAEYYNTGQSGAGNLYIAVQYSTYDKKYKFNDTDLILIMWSTFFREDKYINNQWVTPGNIFTQDIYPEEYIKKYADIRGYLIRDLSIIDITTGSLKNSAADSIQFMAIPAVHEFNEHRHRWWANTIDLVDVVDLFSNIKLPTLIETLEGNCFGTGYEYYNPHYDTSPNKKKIEDNPKYNFTDYHPNILNYLNFLKDVGFELDNSADVFATENHKKYKNYSHVESFFINHPFRNYVTGAVL